MVDNGGSHGSKLAHFTVGKSWLHLLVWPRDEYSPSAWSALLLGLCPLSVLGADPARTGVLGLTAPLIHS